MSEPFGKDIKQVTYIAAPIEKVYDTIASADGWNAFFTTGMQLDPKPGGKMIWRWKDWGPNFYTTEAQAEVVRAERPDILPFSGIRSIKTIRLRLHLPYPPNTAAL